MNKKINSYNSTGSLFFDKRNKALVLLSILALLSSCQPVVVTSTSEQIVSSENTKDKYSITGKVEFPVSKTSESQLSTKATIGQVADRATVSLIYSPDHPTNPNVTIATGLSNANGSFTINPINFRPAVNDIFVLEAIKRIGSTGSSLLSVRTYVKWNGSSYESITTPAININFKTSSITLIDGLNTTINASDCIGKINSATGDIISNIGTVTIPEINQLSLVVNALIINNEDPTSHIMFTNGKYIPINPSNPAKSILLTDKYCPNCDLKNTDLSNADLSNSDLSNSDLSNANLSGAVLTGANLSNVLWIDKSYCSNPSIGLCNSEFKVNTYNTNSQILPSMAADSNGNFIVTWTSSGLYGSGDGGQDGSFDGIYAQRYDKSGIAQGAEFQVNTYTTGIQVYPSVAMDSSGNFIIVWSSGLFSGGGSVGIYAKRYNNSGVAIGTEFKVNTYTTDTQYRPRIAMDSAGNFVITWHSGNFINGTGQDGSGYGVYAQRYNSQGIAQGSEFQVNTYTVGRQEAPEIASDQAGNFVIAWQSSGGLVGQDGSGRGIYAQRYNSAGVAQGTEFKVNTYTTGEQLIPSIAMDNSGNFVITWQSSGQDGSGDGIYAQRFNTQGVAQGSEFKVNTYITLEQRKPKIASDRNGNFVISWSGAGNGDSYGIYAQKYNSAGITQGTEFQVNSYTTNNQSFSNMVMDNSGNFSVAWHSGNDADNSTEVFCKRYKF